MDKRMAHNNIFLLLQTNLSNTRIDKYFSLANNNEDDTIKLYQINLKLCENLYIPLNYFEIILRNYINNRLKKEFLRKFNNEKWWQNNKLFFGTNKNNDDKILNAISLIKQDSKTLNSDNIVSSLMLGFWTSLFNKYNEDNIWKPYLKYIFKDYTRENLFIILKEINNLRNKIFHYKCILFDNLIDIYNNIISLILYMSNNDLVNYIKNMSNFEEVYNDFTLLGKSISPNKLLMRPHRISNVIIDNKNNLSSNNIGVLNGQDS
ncbi:MAG: hypothetical protein Ta2D_09210 [Rickettsiales bacterium]|nr:MAG: hypothetical protein Ta2D_09210 [Rickettsiales bacterium]